MKKIYLLQGAAILDMGCPLLLQGPKPFKPAPGIEPQPCMDGVGTIAMRVPQFGAAHDAALALLTSGQPAMWCLSKDRYQTPPTAALARFVLPSPWSYLVIAARVREITERKGHTTVHLDHLTGQ